MEALNCNKQCRYEQTRKNKSVGKYQNKIKKVVFVSLSYHLLKYYSHIRGSFVRSMQFHDSKTFLMHFTEIFIKIYKETVNILLQAIFLKMATFCFNDCSAQFWHSLDEFLKCLRCNIIPHFVQTIPETRKACWLQISYTSVQFFPQQLDGI